MRKKTARLAALLVLTVFPLRLWPGEAPGPRPLRAAAFSLALFDARTTATVVAASAAPSSETFTLRSLTRDFLKDAGQIWSSPVHIKARDLLPIAGLAALTGFLVANDEAISRGFRTFNDKHGWVRDASPVITKMGSWGALATAGVFLGVGLVAGDHKSTETSVLAADAMLQSAILVGFLKGVFGRQRPSFADGEDHWSGPVGFFKRFSKEHRDAYDSFPSGHTITAFSLATVLAMQYRETVWVPILSYTVATGVGLSRVTMGRHWLSDALVAGVLGHLIGRLVVRNHRQRYHMTPVAGLSRGDLSLAVTLSH